MISGNIAHIRRRIADACARSGRVAGEVTLIAVTKTFSPDHIRAACDAGICDIGENYVQELVAKREALADREIRWHFIGHLQSNKAKQIVPWISLIHSVESLALAKELDKRASQSGRILEILVEVNTTSEGSKFGVAPGNTVAFIRTLAPLENIRIAGLMTVGPFLPDPEGSRPMFRMLRDLRERVAQLGQRNVEMRHLSMGMTGDFDVAVEEGATLVRIGTALFGARMKRP